MIDVHPNAPKHGLTEDDILCAWDNVIRLQYREADDVGQVVAIGTDGGGRLVELVGVDKPFGMLIYHANTPPSARVLAELGLARR